MKNFFLIKRQPQSKEKELMKTPLSLTLSSSTGIRILGF